MSGIGNIYKALITDGGLKNFVESPKNKQLVKEFLPLLMATHEQGPLIGFLGSRTYLAYQVVTDAQKTKWDKSIESVILIAMAIIGLKYPRAQLLLSSTSQIKSFISRVSNTQDRKQQAIATLKILPFCIYLASLQAKKGNPIVLYTLSHLMVSRLVESMRAV